MDIGTLLHTWIHGKLVGTDEFGNRYYKNKGGSLYGRERRWVLYKGRRCLPPRGPRFQGRYPRPCHGRLRSLEAGMICGSLAGALR